MSDFKFFVGGTFEEKGQICEIRESFSEKSIIYCMWKNVIATQ